VVVEFEYQDHRGMDLVLPPPPPLLQSIQWDDGEAVEREVEGTDSKEYEPRKGLD
jgi:hypothetical protein